MNVRTFRAPTMAEALALVKRHLGGDAVILHTRSTRVGGIFGWRSRPVVEITASDQASVRPRRAADVSPAQRSAAGAAAIVPAPAAVAAYQRQSRHSEALESHVIPPQPRMPRAAQPQTLVAPTPGGDSAEPSMSGEASSGVTMQVRARRGASHLSTSAPLAPESPEAASVLYRELADIKLLVNQVLQTAPTGAIMPAGANMPEALFRHYLRLLESQVSREIADVILTAVRDELSSGELSDEQIVRSAVLRHLGAMLPVADGIAAPRQGADGRPHTIALVGPTGVGKTTTVAKLAATFKLRQGRSVGLITSDTYRIAAVEQLRTYASIIGLPLKVVLTPAEMAAAVESFRAFDVVLIDTAGRSQNATDRLMELEQFLDAARPHETHLVLSTASGEDVLVQTAESFARVKPNRILLTKLDEAVNFGVVANVLRRLARQGLVAPGEGLPLSFMTTGQEVPDHIEQGRADRLARMILDNSLTSDTTGAPHREAPVPAGVR